MILAVDVYYGDFGARAVGLIFPLWTSEKPAGIIIQLIPQVEAYEPGAFYKRELPCILQVLKQTDLKQLAYIIIDGYVILDDAGTYGLGGYLFEALERKTPVIGVAKTRFLRNTRLHKAVLRGQSNNPLFVTALGVDLEEAAGFIRQMSGPNRMPDLLKQLDMETKKTL